MILEVLKKAWSMFGGNEDSAEPWASDEEAFEQHFGEPYESFCERLSTLDQAHTQLYEKTAGCNPEAAVCWVFFITSNEAG